ncbi:MAG: sigma-70 family RNA polymerase sigma factor [Bdellovibrionota bacterium]
MSKFFLIFLTAFIYSLYAVMYRFKKNNKIPTAPTIPVLSTLIHAFQNGEQQAFSEIYNRYSNPILKYVLRHTRDTEIAQDLTQEIFFKIFRFRSSYRPEHGFSTWIWTIAKNTIFDALRKKPAATIDIPADDLPSPRPDAEKVLERKTQWRSLLRALKKLTSPQRKVVWMRIVYELPYNEIAKRLDVSISAVKCLAYRSKRALGEIENAIIL